MLTSLALLTLLALAALLGAASFRRSGESAGPWPALRASDLWRTDGELDRGAYLCWGVLLFALKHNLDRLVATAAFGRRWTVFNYLSPAEGLFDLDAGDLRFYGTLAVLSLPFLWAGVALTVRRLRSAGLPRLLVLLFVVPAANLLFFAALAAAPPARERAEAGRLERWLPEGPFGAAAAAVVLSGLPVVLLSIVSVRVLKGYGLGLFVGLPFVLGLLSSALAGWRAPRSLGFCLLAATLSAAFAALALLALAVEGVFCIAMAAPLALPLAWLGAAAGWCLQRSRGGAFAALTAAPLLMGAERAADPEPPLFEAATAIEVDAPPERVWERVLRFSELAPPEEWYFRAGIAYPVRARLEGEGPGAVRRCEFSTGAFEEPITAWEPPRRLAFDVRSQPEPMEEWTFWPRVRPAHLEGYFASERGEFLLVPLPGGRTRLEGRTWYRHGLWPAGYWKLWSDALVRRIHLRVLRHIRAEAERA